MNQILKVSFESPQSGWMALGLSAGEQSLRMAASYTPYDSLRDLIEGLSQLLTDGARVTVKWNCEPEEYDFNFVLEGDRVRFDVVRYPDHRRIPDASRIVFSVSGSKLDICGPFWSELRDLRRRISTDAFDQNWRREFPQREMQQFTKLIRALKHEAKLETSASGGD